MDEGWGWGEGEGQQGGEMLRAEQMLTDKERYFEGADKGRWSGWRGGTVALSSTYSHSGSKSLKVGVAPMGQLQAGIPDPDDGPPFTGFPVEGGEAIEVSWWLKKPNITGGGNCIWVLGRDASGNNTDGVLGGPHEDITSWQYVEGSWTLSSRTRFVYVAVAGVGGWNVYLDDVSILIGIWAGGGEGWGGC